MLSRVSFGQILGRRVSQVLVTMFLLAWFIVPVSLPTSQREVLGSSSRSCMSSPRCTCSQACRCPHTLLEREYPWRSAAKESTSVKMCRTNAHSCTSIGHMSFGWHVRVSFMIWIWWTFEATMLVMVAQSCGPPHSHLRHRDTRNIGVGSLAAEGYRCSS